MWRRGPGPPRPSPGRAAPAAPPRPGGRRPPPQARRERPPRHFGAARRRLGAGEQRGGGAVTGRERGEPADQLALPDRPRDAFADELVADGARRAQPGRAPGPAHGRGARERRAAAQRQGPDPDPQAAEQARREDVLGADSGGDPRRGHPPLAPRPGPVLAPPRRDRGAGSPLLPGGQRRSDSEAGGVRLRAGQPLTFCRLPRGGVERRASGQSTQRRQ